MSQQANLPVCSRGWSPSPKPDVHLTLGISVEEVERRLNDPFQSRVSAEYCYSATTSSDWDPHLDGKLGGTLDSPKTIQHDLIVKFLVDKLILNTIPSIVEVP